MPSNASCTLLLVCVSVNKSPITNMAKIAHVVVVMVMVMVIACADLGVYILLLLILYTHNLISQI